TKFGVLSTPAKGFLRLNPANLGSVRPRGADRSPATRRSGAGDGDQDRPRRSHRLQAGGLASGRYRRHFLACLNPSRYERVRFAKVGQTAPACTRSTREEGTILRGSVHLLVARKGEWK